MPRPRPVLALVGTLLALVLGACGGSTGEAAPAESSAPASPAPADSTPATSGSPSSSPSDDSAAFCSELQANGASGSDFGAIPTFYPKEELLDDVRGKLKAMGDATPPAEIASAWALQKSTLRRVEAAAKKLPSGGRLNGARYASSDAVEEAEKQVTDYWFATCR